MAITTIPTRVRWGILIIILCAPIIPVVGAESTEQIVKQTNSTKTKNVTSVKSVENQPRYQDFSLGDVLISSSTIIGFTGIGTVLAVRIKGQNGLKQQVLISLGIYTTILILIIIHLFVIVSVIDGSFTTTKFVESTYITIGLVVILIGAFAGLNISQAHAESQEFDLMTHIVDPAIKKHYKSKD